MNPAEGTSLRGDACPSTGLRRTVFWVPVAALAARLGESVSSYTVDYCAHEDYQRIISARTSRLGPPPSSADAGGGVAGMVVGINGACVGAAGGTAVDAGGGTGVGVSGTGGSGGGYRRYRGCVGRERRLGVVIDDAHGHRDYIPSALSVAGDCLEVVRRAVLEVPVCMVSVQSSAT